MLRLALAGNPHYEIDAQEIERGGSSYTIDTVRDYARRFPNSELFYMIGADHIPTLPKWREAEALSQLAQFVVLPRPGEPCADAPSPFRVNQLKGWPIGLSSSEIRARVKASLPIGPLVPFGVEQVILGTGLYRD